MLPRHWLNLWLPFLEAEQKHLLNRKLRGGISTWLVSQKKTLTIIIISYGAKSSGLSCFAVVAATADFADPSPM